VLAALGSGGWNARVAEIGREIAAPLFRDMLADAGDGTIQVQGQGLMWGGSVH
jgi:hypothetical protein